MPHSEQKSPAALLAIGVFKLVKGLLLVATGLGALSLLHRDLFDTIGHWVAVLRVDPDNEFIHAAIGKLLNVTPQQLKAIGAGTFFYAALLLTEGIGLLLRKHWAEYFTVITTAALVPLEVYELVKHLTALKVLVLLVNVVIVVYLVLRLRSERSSPASAASAAA
jgi:uncharacterized membrane protein (DUF2068 family)